MRNSKKPALSSRITTLEQNIQAIKKVLVALHSLLPVVRNLAQAIVLAWSAITLVLPTQVTAEAGEVQKHISPRTSEASPN